MELEAISIVTSVLGSPYVPIITGTIGSGVGHNCKMPWNRVLKLRNLFFCFFTSSACSCGIGKANVLFYCFIKIVKYRNTLWFTALAVYNELSHGISAMVTIFVDAYFFSHLLSVSTQ